VVSDIADMAETGAHEAILTIANAGSAAEPIDMAATVLAALGEQGLHGPADQGP
jgi:hypothetical protein